VEIFNRLVILAVGAAMVVFGYQNFLLDFGSVRAPSLIPLSTYTASVPIAGVLICENRQISVPIAGVLICLFSLEQIANGWRHGFEGPEDKDDFAGIK
jgi:TRAP-type C4-dicarboxylate transport system permease small subunit